MMLPGQVADVLTPCDPAGMFWELTDAWAAFAAEGDARFADEPTRARVLVLLAQSIEECGAGYKSCHCWNFGNVKHVEGDGHEWCAFRCDEVIGGRVVWFDPPHPACRFVAFRARAEGVRGYLEELRGRFHAAWPALLTGDPIAFVHALKLQKYFTADEGAYGRAVAWLDVFEGRQLGLERPLAPNPQGGALLALADAVDAGAEGLPPEPKES